MFENRSHVEAGRFRRCFYFVFFFFLFLLFYSLCFFFCFSLFCVCPPPHLPLFYVCPPPPSLSLFPSLCLFPSSPTLFFIFLAAKRRCLAPSRCSSRPRGRTTIEETRSSNQGCQTVHGGSHSRSIGKNKRRTFNKRVLTEWATLFFFFWHEQQAIF